MSVSVRATLIYLPKRAEEINSNLHCDKNLLFSVLSTHGEVEVE